MLRTLSLTALVGAAVAFGLSTYAVSQRGTSLSLAVSPAKCGNPIPVEPVVNFDVTGGTLAGPFHRRLTVYSNGAANVSTATTFPPSSDARTTNVSQSVVDDLRKALEDAGAFALCDQDISVADLPLSTVTVFEGGTDGTSHTYSYWLGIKGWSAPNQILVDFIATHFPGF